MQMKLRRQLQLRVQAQGRRQLMGAWVQGGRYLRDSLMG